MRASRALLALTLLLPAMGAMALGDKSCQNKAGQEAIHRLKDWIKSQGLYASWAKEGCLMYYPVGCDAAAAQIQVREFHSPKCGGDPHVAPVVNDFRVDMRSLEILVYDFEEDDFVELSKSLANDNR